MKRLNSIFARALMAMGFLALTACPDTKTHPAKSAALRADLPIAGDYWKAGADGIREDEGIEKTGDPEFPYFWVIYDNDKQPPQKSKIPFQVFSYDNTLVAFVRYAEESDEESGYLVVKLEISKTQVVARSLRSNFIKENPVIAPKGADPSALDPLKKVSAENLESFFKLYASKEELWETEPYLLNRVAN